MRRSVVSCLVTLLAVGATAAARAQVPPKAAQPAPKTKAAAPAPPAAQPKAANPPRVIDPKLEQVVATVNGEPIKRGEVLDTLSKYTLPPGSEEQLYTGAVNALANIKLVNQFLAREKVAVAPKDVDDMVAKIQAELKAEGRDLANTLADNGITMPELRGQFEQTLRWRNYVIGKATDPILKTHFDANKDLFNKTQVRASHILVKVEPDASADAKEKAKQKILGIKKEIESNAITFEDAANKYSEDDGNVQTKAGGDLGYFQRKGAFIEKFAAAAFGMKKGSISDPVETEYGWHLIRVTDRKEGDPADFAQIKPFVTNQYAVELQESIVAKERGQAKIDIKKMPIDLFPPAPPPTPTQVAPPAGAPAPKAATPAPTPKPAPR